MQPVLGIPSQQQADAVCGSCHHWRGWDGAKRVRCARMGQPTEAVVDCILWIYEPGTDWTRPSAARRRRIAAFGDGSDRPAGAVPPNGMVATSPAGPKSNY